MAISVISAIAVPTPENANDTTAKVQPGQVIADKDGQLYKYVLNGEASTALAAGDLVYFTAAGGTTVKKSGAGQANLPFGGVVLSTAITAAKYGWIKIAGVATSSGLTAGAAVKVTTGGQTFADATVGTDHVVGTATTTTQVQFIGSSI